MTTSRSNPPAPLNLTVAVHDPARRRALKLVGAGALGAALGQVAGGIAFAADGGPLKIGLIVTYSGPYAGYGKQMD
ncbi:hypothetical protein, partial [Paenirhodobacter enshiensis]|uniref:hypothetical protein n=1 Tax=Paenirhodobacter enshiensis TaxID=1105367 RepID=UPI003FA1B3C2